MDNILIRGEWYQVMRIVESNFTTLVAVCYHCTTFFVRECVGLKYIPNLCSRINQAGIEHFAEENSSDS